MTRTNTISNPINKITAPKSMSNLLICPDCNSIGYKGFKKCKTCKGMAVGMFKRGLFLYWGKPLTYYHLSLARARRILNKARLATALILGINFWIWFFLLIYKNKYYLELTGPGGSFNTFGSVLPGFYKILFWLGVISLLYFWYRIIAGKKKTGEVEHYSYKELEKEKDLREPEWNTWEEVFKIPSKKRLDISKTFTDEALAVIARSYKLARKNNSKELLLEHMFYVLLSFNRVSNLFIRLGLPAQVLQNKIKDSIFLSGEDKNLQPIASPYIREMLFESYENAYQNHLHYVGVPEVLLSTINNSASLQDVLMDFDVDNHKLANVIKWAQIREKLYRRYQKFRRAAGRRSKSGMDKAMTAVSTPFLNHFSEDITYLAQMGHIETCVSRDKEIEEMMRIFNSGNKNVLLVGKTGVGRRSIVEGLAEKMIEDDVPDKLKDKRLVRLSISSLLAGTDPAGAVDRVLRILSEISKAKNIVLFIHNIDDIVGVSAGGEKSSLDVADALAEHLKGGRFLTVATTTTEQYNQQIANSNLGGVFSKIEVEEMTEDQAIAVVESKIGTVEYKHKVFFSYNAIEHAVEMAGRYLYDERLPGSALDIVRESAIYAKNKKGANTLVSKEEVSAVISEKTRIPLTSITQTESDKLMNLEEEMHQSIIGQDEAVSTVASALRRARAQMRSNERTIANLLFLGPTGVGKTEVAKTISNIYFGGEENMIRFDMSEYQDKNSIYRLIGEENTKGTGLLTNAVKENPFSLLLLDEIEKADKNVLNLFLQVMDDGRLSDSTGEKIDFTNVILITTSNAATSYVQEQLKNGLSKSAVKERLLHGELSDYFKPEFLNRFDSVVLFNSLSQDDIKSIAGLMLGKVGKQLEEKGVHLEAKDSALDFLAKVGFDPDFGARPMRRAIRDNVENKLADLILQGKIRRKDRVILGGECEILINKE